MLAQLSGSRRGKSDRISGETLLVGTAAESDVRLPADHLSSPGSIHAVLRSRGVTYEIEAAPGQSVWVNGEPVLNMDGEIVAVNSAVLPEFGGSNMGVPAAASLALLEGVEPTGN